MFIFTNDTAEQPGAIILTVCVIWSGGLHLLFVTNRFFIYYFLTLQTHLPFSNGIITRCNLY